MSRYALRAVQYEGGDGIRPRPRLALRLQVKRQFRYRNGVFQDPISALSGWGLGTAHGHSAHEHGDPR